MSKRLEHAWAAGLFDGEGCVRLRKGKATDGLPNEARYISLHIHQRDREVLDRFAAAVEGGKVRGPYNGVGMTRTTYFQWGEYASAEARRICALLLPHLSEPKRAKMQEALAGEVRLASSRIPPPQRKGRKAA